MRLGKNIGRYHGESIPIDAVQAGIHELAMRHGWKCDTFLDANELTLRAYRRAGSPNSPNIYLSSGIHGDEPSGPLALLRLFEDNRWPDANFWIVPCLNPTGFRLNTRENREGIDLNRDYRHLKTIEVAAHVRWLEQQPRFDLSILLHEDWEAHGFYIYELNPENRPSLVDGLIEAIRELCPIQPTGPVDDWDCVAGVIRPQVHPNDRPLWAEALYLRVNKSSLNYTLETPSDFPLEFRVKVHSHAVAEALCTYHSATTCEG